MRIQPGKTSTFAPWLLGCFLLWAVPDARAQSKPADDGKAPAASTSDASKAKKPSKPTTKAPSKAASKKAKAPTAKTPAKAPNKAPVGTAAKAPNKAPAKTPAKAAAKASAGAAAKTPPAPPRLVPARRLPAPRAKPKSPTKATAAPVKPLPTTKAGCVGLYRSRQYGRAGECFEKLGLGFGPGSKLPQLRRYAKGQMLRNAAVAFEKEALLASRVEVAAFLRERAVALLQIYQKERLCENAYRCRIALDLETRIARKIGQLQLTIVTNHNNSLVVIKGYRFKSSFQNRISLTVRPGTYSIRVVYPNEKKPREKKVQLKPGEAHIETFFPKIEQRSVSKVSLGLYIAAGVLIASGGTMAGVGAARWVIAEQEWDDPTTRRSAEPVLTGQREAAQPLIWSGAGAAGVGVVLLIMGFAFHTPPAPPKAVAPPGKRATPLAGASSRHLLQLR